MTNAHAECAWLSNNVKDYYLTSKVISWSVLSAFASSYARSIMHMVFSLLLQDKTCYLKGFVHVLYVMADINDIMTLCIILVALSVALACNCPRV